MEPVKRWIRTVRRLSDSGRGVCGDRPGGSLPAADPVPGQALPLRPLSRLCAVPPGEGPGVSGERAGRRAGGAAAPGSVGGLEPGALAPEGGAERGGAADGAAEEGLPAGRVCDPTEPGPSAPTPCCSLLRQQLLLPHVQESSWNQLRKSDQTRYFPSNKQV